MHWKAINVTLHPSRSLQQSPANPHFITCHHIPHIAFTNNNRPVRHFIHLTWSYRPAAVLTRQAHSLARPPSNTLKTTVQRPAQSLSLTLRKRRRKKNACSARLFLLQESLHVSRSSHTQLMSHGWQTHRRPAHTGYLIISSRAQPNLLLTVGESTSSPPALWLWLPHRRSCQTLKIHA